MRSLTLVACATVMGAIAGEGQAQPYASKLESTRPAVLRSELIPLVDALDRLEKAYHVNFVYEDSLIADKKSHRLKKYANDFYKDLQSVIEGNAIQFDVVGGRTVVLMPVHLSAKQRSELAGTIRGRITDENNRGIAAAQVLVAGTSLGAAADESGDYFLENMPLGRLTLLTKMIGYRPERVEVTVDSTAPAVHNFSLAEDPLAMEEVVTTAARIPLTKLESSVAITTLGDREITENPPRSAAEIMQSIPGFYVESSGGESGNNLFPRGIPQDGSYRYVAIYEDGLPVYEAPELAFANADVLVRVDETLQVIEGVRGGTGSILASNAPGGIVNFISKTGGTRLQGNARVAASDYGLLRLDFNYGGPLSKNWRFNFGGFFRQDNGIRSPGFVANRGGQFKGNVTRFFNGGYLRLHAKYLNDRNIFLLPIPLRNLSKPESISGFDASYGTLTSLAANPGSFPTPRGDFIERDIRDGVHPVLHSVSGELFFDLGKNWYCRNATRLMTADLQFNAIFSLDSPFQAVDFAEQEKGLQPSAGYSRWEYRDARTGQALADPVNLNGNGLVARAGWWSVTKPLRNVINDLQLQHYAGAHAFSVGLYYSHYTASDFWYWHNILTEVKTAPRLLDLVAYDRFGTPIYVTKNGFEQFGTSYLNAESGASVWAGYLTDEWILNERLRIDLGLRIEHDDLSGKVENTRGDFEIPNATTEAEKNVTFGDGTFRRFDYQATTWALSLGCNYSLANNLAVYLRGSRGFRLPDFDQWLMSSAKDPLPDQNGNSQNVLQFESGIKLNGKRVGLFGTLFFSRLNNIPFTDQVFESGRITSQTRFAASTTVGAEVEANWHPARNLTLHLISTLQDPRLRGLEFQELSGDSGSFAIMNLDGNRVRRIPAILVDFRPEVLIGRARVFGSFQYVGERFADDANTAILPSYGVLNTGVSYRLAKNDFFFSVYLLNLTNTLGLTESNPRIDQVSARRSDIFMARPIPGRSSVISLNYGFGD